MARVWRLRLLSKILFESLTSTFINTSLSTFQIKSVLICCYDAIWRDKTMKLRQSQLAYINQMLLLNKFDTSAFQLCSVKNFKNMYIIYSWVGIK